MKLLAIGAASALLLTIGLNSTQAAVVVHKHGVVHRAAVVRPVVIHKPVVKRRVVKVHQPLTLTYTPVVHLGSVYYLRDGIYYRKQANKYLVVAPVSGLRITSLPRNAVVVRISGESLFRANDVYYRQTGGLFIVV